MAAAQMAKPSQKRLNEAQCSTSYEVYLQSKASSVHRKVRYIETGSHNYLFLRHRSLQIEMQMDHSL